MILAKRTFIDTLLLKKGTSKDKYEYWRKYGYEESTIRRKLIFQCNQQFQQEIVDALNGVYTKESILDGYNSIIARNEGVNDKIVLATYDSIAKLIDIVKDNIVDVNININQVDKPTESNG